MAKKSKPRSAPKSATRRPKKKTAFQIVSTWMSRTENRPVNDTLQFLCDFIDGEAVESPALLTSLEQFFED